MIKIPIRYDEQFVKRPRSEYDYTEEEVRKHLLDIFLATNKDKEAYDECQILKNLNSEDPNYPFYMAELLLKGGDTSEKILGLLNTTKDLDSKYPHLDFLFGYY